MKLSDTATIREADRRMIEDHHYPGILLMEEAGKQATRAILQDFPDQKRFVVLAGPGNNGGDGFVIARLLHLAGKEVQVLLSKAESELSKEGDAAVMFRVLKALPVPVQAWQAGAIRNLPVNTLLVDALLGTGIQSQVRGTIANMIAEAVESALQAIAVDLPSGLNADTGAVINQVIPAQYTYTFQLPKICQYITPAATFCGNIRVLDIGIWPSVIASLNSRFILPDEAWLRHHWKRRGTTDHKGSFGHVLIVAGSRNMAGAAILATKSALRSGAGLVTVACPGAVRIPLLSACPEAMCIPLGDPEEPVLTSRYLREVLAAVKGKSAVLIGPGIGQEEETQTFVGQFLDHLREDFPAVPVVIDADGLNSIARHPLGLPPTSILTPHPGEMKRLLGPGYEQEVQTDRLAASQTCVQRWQATTVLKGAGTITATPDERIYVNPTGNPALATGGSGDVLAGLITALLAQGYEPAIAASMGVYLHGKAADLWVESEAAEALTAGSLADWVGRGFPG